MNVQAAAAAWQAAAAGVGSQHACSWGHGESSFAHLRRRAAHDTRSPATTAAHATSASNRQAAGLVLIVAVRLQRNLRPAHQHRLASRPGLLLQARPVRAEAARRAPVDCSACWLAASVESTQATQACTRLYAIAGSGGEWRNLYSRGRGSRRLRARTNAAAYRSARQLHAPTNRYENERNDGRCAQGVHQTCNNHCPAAKEI